MEECNLSFFLQGYDEWYTIKTTKIRNSILYSWLGHHFYIDNLLLKTTNGEIIETAGKKYFVKKAP